MPILDVEIVRAPGEKSDAGLAAALAEGAGKVFASPPGRTWVKLRDIAADQYAENGGGPAPGILPVFVTVLKARWEQNGLGPEVAALTEVVAERCGRPAENVHVLYVPPAAGRIAFGGRLVTA